MPRYKPVDRSPRLLPVVLSEHIQSGTFLKSRFNNDEVSASAYGPHVMLKIVLPANHGYVQ